MTGNRETVSTAQVLDGGFFRIVRDRVRLPDGAEHEYMIVKHPGAVAVVPVDAHGRVLMVRQYRQAIGDSLLELPAGKIDPGEDPWVCGRRELQEETGYGVEHLELLASFFASPGISDEKIHVFLGTGLRSAQPAPGSDGGEPISLEWLEPDQILHSIDDGRVEDGKSIVGLALYKLRELSESRDVDL